MIVQTSARAFNMLKTPDEWLSIFFLLFVQKYALPQINTTRAKYKVSTYLRSFHTECERKGEQKLSLIFSPSLGVNEPLDLLLDLISL